MCEHSMFNGFEIFLKEYRSSMSNARSKQDYGIPKWGVVLGEGDKKDEGQEAPGY